MNIIKMGVVSCSSILDFNNKLAENIELYQNEGLDVEIQYQTANNCGSALFTAILLGRGKNIEKRNSN